jgi:xanthine dehydrogenase large subunit
MSSVAHAEVVRIDLSAVLAAPGVIDVCIASDIAGTNNFGPIIEDDPIFATDLVQYAGQPVFAVAATTVDAARKASRLGDIEYRELDAILDPLAAVEAGSFVLPSETLVRGEPDAALKSAPHRARHGSAAGRWLPAGLQLDAAP